jgi:hypothetical protein
LPGVGFVACTDVAQVTTDTQIRGNKDFTNLRGKVEPIADGGNERGLDRLSALPIQPQAEDCKKFVDLDFEQS